MGRAAKREARKKREQKLSIEEQADVDIRGFGIGTHVRFNCPGAPHRHGKEGVIDGVHIPHNETQAERTVDFGNDVGCGAYLKELVDIGCKACSNHEKNAIHKDGGAHGHAFEPKQEPICVECGFPQSDAIHQGDVDNPHPFKATIVKASEPEVAVKRTTIELLGPEFTVELARVDPTQVFNVREVITENTIMVRMRAIRQGTTKAIVLYPADKAKEIAPADFMTDKEFIPLAGNITLLAALRDERTTYQARLFLGTPEEAKYYVGADNEGAVQLTSFERARWYASLQTQTSLSYTELANELLEWGVYVSPGQLSNLVSAYRNLLPQIREAWAERRLLTPDETDDDLPVWARLVTDECLFWLKSKNANQQLLIWERMKDGDSWKAIRAAEKEKAPEGIKPPKHQLYGRAIVPPKPQMTFDRIKFLKIEVAKNNPEIVHLIEPIVAYMMTDLPLPKVMSFLESKNPVPPKKKIPARPIAVKTTKRKLAAKSARR